MTSAVVAVVGVLLLSPLIQAQDPVVIRVVISTGVQTDQIVFKDGFCVDMSPLTRNDLCSSLVSLHEMNNQAFLGVTITTDDCTGALESEMTYTKPELDEWSGSYCGTCTKPVSPPSAHNFICGDSSPGPIYLSACTHVTPAGTSGYIEAGSTILVRGDDQEFCSDKECPVYDSTFVGYPFTPVNSPTARCIVKVTGTDGFLECLTTVGPDLKRASVGYHGSYAQYIKGCPI